MSFLDGNITNAEGGSSSTNGWFIFTRKFKVSPSITIPVGEVWKGNMSTSSGIVYSWTLVKDPLTVGSSIGGSDAVSKISGGGMPPFEKTNDPQISEPKPFAPRTGTNAQAEADKDLSFFDKYKTYILVGSFIVVAVVGYFIYDKYFK